MSDFFRMDGLPAVKHTPETKEKIRALNGNRSIAMRKAIKTFAVKEGFSWRSEDGQPAFVDDKCWQDYCQRQQKSKRVDYSYLIAFGYLRHKFSDLSASTLQRRVILQAL